MLDIAIFGGSFDPLHLGHLNIAQHAAKLAREVLFVPCYKHAFNKPIIASAEHRANMIDVAIQPFKNYRLDRREITKETMSYTVDTLKSFHKEGISKIGLIVGSDAVLDFAQWKSPEEVADLATLLIFNRPGVPQKKLKDILQSKLFSKADIKLISDVINPISSTQIKLNYYLYQPLNDFVPAAVLDYIHKNGLYQREKIIDGDEISIMGQRYQQMSMRKEQMMKEGGIE